MYDNYIALDWAQANMAVARISNNSDRPIVKEGSSDILGLKSYLDNLKGTKILTIEESTSSQWLYIELKNSVDKIIICDPCRNHLLSEGAKTDKIDAIKLVQLLKSNLLKEVYHTGNDLIYIRKIVSAYDDLILAGVRLKNQRSALFRANGKDHKKEEGLELASEQFVLEGIDRAIESYEKEKQRYENEFIKLAKKYPSIQLIKSMPGIGAINAVKVMAYVVEARRFKTKGQFLSYCGLIKHDRISGGKSYGKKNPRFCRPLKGVFKTAAITAIPENRGNPLRDYYFYLIQEKRYADYDARNAIARRIAVLTLGVLKSEKKFEWHRSPKNKVIV